MLPDAQVTVSEFVDLVNETFTFAFPSIVISGELANFRVSKNKWLYFDLKDESASVRFFGTVYNLPGPLEDGMMVQVRGVPHLHELYGFSVNVQTITAAGEGSIRRAAALLAAKLEAEGLFDASRKRRLPAVPQRIGLITSGQSAAYADFMKILGARWGGITIEFVDVQVQGEAAPPQLVDAIERFNALAAPPEVLVIIRGGGSADDLAAFSHEHVARAVAASRVPTLVAVGHEIDTSLAELAADLRASTPSNAAELLVPDKQVVLRDIAAARAALSADMADLVAAGQDGVRESKRVLGEAVTELLDTERSGLAARRQLLHALSPEAALRRGYAVVRGDDGRAISGALPSAPSGAVPVVPIGAIVRIELLECELAATITAVSPRSRRSSARGNEINQETVT